MFNINRFTYYELQDLAARSRVKLVPERGGSGNPFTLQLKSDSITRSQYPFDFELDFKYSLKGTLSLWFMHRAAYHSGILF